MVLMQFPVTIKAGYARVKIYRGHQKSGVPVYSVTYWSSGKCVRKSFSDYDVARAEADAIVAKLIRGEGRALDMTAMDRSIYIRSLDFLQSTGISVDLAASRVADAVRILGGDRIIDAAREYADRHRIDQCSKTVPEVIDEMLAAKAAAGRSKRHLADLRSRLGAFGRAAQGSIAEVSRDMIRMYIDHRPVAAQSKRNDIARIRSLFKFAIARGYAPPGHDVLTGIELPNMRPGAIEIYTPAELRTILDHASPKIVPAIVLGAFAGLRSAEIERLTWGEIGPEWITISAAKAKTASRRLVPILPVLRQWIKRTNNKTGLIWNGTHRQYYLVMRREIISAGVVPRTNALRHSFISYRLASIHDTARVALEAGNSPAVVFSHYRELVTPDQADEWFACMPRPAQ